MAITVVDTPSAPDANSYVSVSAADTYFASRMNTAAWDALTTANDDDGKARALITATARLEQERYVGTKTDPKAALKWPRAGVTDEDGVALDPATIPSFVIAAECEMALWLLNNSDGTDDPFAGTGLEQFKRLKVGPLDLELNTPPTSAGPDKGPYERVPGDPATSIAVSRWQLPFQVQRLLRFVLTTDLPTGAATVVAPGFVRLARG